MVDPVESEIRQRMVKRVLEEYPTTDCDYADFLGSAKCTIDSWLGDTFPVVLREMGLTAQYEKYRSVLFRE
jgi:hypothetical protein